MYRKLLKSIRDYKRQTLLAPFFVMLEVVMDVLIPFNMGRLIDEGINGQDMTALWRIGTLLIFMVALSMVFGVMSGRFAAQSSAGFAKNLRQDVFHKVQEFSFENIDKFSTGSLITRLTTDITNIQQAFQMSVRVGFRAPMMIVFALLMTLRINWRISLIYLIMVPILGYGLTKITRIAHPKFKQAFKVYDKLNVIVQENLEGIRVVKAFVREKFENKKMTDVSSQMYEKFSKAERTVAFNAPLLNFSVYLSMILLMWFATVQIMGGQMTTGELISCVSYTMQILMNLNMLSMIFVMLTISDASMQRVTEVLAEEPTIANQTAPLTTVDNGEIIFDDVCFKYTEDSEEFSLEDINVTIPSGSFVGIIGGTGSSKSTLVQLIPRLYDATQGQVKVAGQNVQAYDLEVLRDAVAIVLQKNTLFSGTIKDNLRWGNETSTDEEMVHACQLAHADEFIQDFADGYDAYVEQGGRNLSGGQKQRLCIARALLKQPKILILDDSTSAVDTKTEAQIRENLSHEMPDVTTVLIAQRIVSVEQADFIIVMDNGKIDQIGTHDELLASNQIYQEVYASQVKGGLADND